MSIFFAVCIFVSVLVFLVVCVVFGITAIAARRHFIASARLNDLRSAVLQADIETGAGSHSNNA